MSQSEVVAVFAVTFMVLSVIFLVVVVVEDNRARKRRGEEAKQSDLERKFREVERETDQKFREMELKLGRRITAAQIETEQNCRQRSLRS